MACNNALRTQSWFDGALDAGEARDAERHIATCADCTNLLRDMESLRKAVKENASYHRADPGLRTSVLEKLDAVRGQATRAPWIALRARQYWGGVLSGAVAAAAAAAVAFMLLLPSDADEVVADVTAAHVRSLVGTHLLDVASNDPHVVKPWLNRHAGISPPVMDLAAKGYRLIGARSDYVYEGGAGVTVYRRHGHVVNLFAWTTDDDDTLPATANSAGYNIVIWKKGNVVYCAVSNVAMDDLQNFAKLVQGA